MIKKILLNLYRALAVAFGVCVSTVLPVILWAISQQESNAEVGYFPNMDPAVMVVIAQLFATPIVLVVLCAELVLICVFCKETPFLSYSSLVLLGCFAAWPISVYILDGVAQSD